MNMDTKLNLHQRKAAVMLAVKNIPTNGYNSFGKYHYATQADVWNTLRPLLAEHGLDFTVSDVGHEWNESKNRTILTTEIELTNIDNPEDCVVVTVKGEANDKTDKGMSKARSAAIKYWLLHTFLIATGSEDDDADSGPAPKKTPGAELATVEQKKRITALMKQLGYEGTKAIDEALVARSYPKLALLKQGQIGGLKTKLEASIKEKGK
jgi:hypothetical protein